MFIQPDEYMILMDQHEFGELEPYNMTADEMRMIRDAGVKTVYRQAAVRWDLCQPAPDAPFDWSTIDVFMERAQKAGLKVLLPFIYSIPEWKPDDYFLRRERVFSAYGIPNYNNPAVADELDALITEMIQRYSSTDCQVINAIPINGELPFHIGTHDGNWHVEPDVYIDWIVSRQRLFEAENQEIWTAYHPFTDPVWWRPVYDALFEAFPNSHHYGIIFTYVQHDFPYFHAAIEYNQKRGMIYYGGTEYTEGIRRNVPKLIHKGLRMITAPKHTFTKTKTVTPNMVEEIRWAIEQYDTDWIML